MKKFLSLLLSTVLLISIVAVFPSKANATQVVASRVVKTSEGKAYLEVNGKPFLAGHVQNCGKQQLLIDQSLNTPYAPPMPISWLENDFEKTKAAGFKTISIVIKWNEWEPTTKGVYDWTLIDKYIDWCNQYGLYLDIAYFGSNSCGGTRLPGYPNAVVSNVPDYVEDHDKYFGNPDFVGEVHCPWLPIVGDSHYADAQFLMDSEISAITALMNHLAVYDTNKRTIFFQVQNEPDWHTKYNQGQKQYVWNWFNAIGNAIKNSNYVCATRVNGGNAMSHADFKTIDALDGVDAVGDDAYTTSVSTISNIIKNDLGGTGLPHIAENDGSYNNHSSLAIASLTNGGYYDVWQLNDHWMDQSLYDPSVHYNTWTLGTPAPLRHGGQDLANLFPALYKADQVIALAPPSRMAGFNIETDNPSSNYSSSKLVYNYQIGYSSTDGSVGMAVTNGNYVYCMSDSAGQQPVNLAIGRTATMNATPFETHPASSAIDGNASTYAQSNSDVPWDLTIDLGSSMTINRVEYKAGSSNYATQFTIDTSTDGSNWTTVATETAGTGGNKTYDFASTTARYVKCNVTQENGGGADWGHAIYEFGIYNTGGTIDRALNKTVTADSVWGAGFEASLAVDGSDSTRWSSKSTGQGGSYPHWLKVDLGSNYDINQVKVNWTAAYGIDYKVQVSTDGTNFTDVVTVTGNNSEGIKTHNFATVNARYVRVYVTLSNQAGTNVSIWTINVYGN
jgi:hypothetical protein